MSEREGALLAGALPFGLFFEQHPLPAWVLSLTPPRFLAVNAAALEAYGFGREEFLALDPRELRPPEDVAAFEGWLGEARRAPPRGRHFLPGIWRHRRKDGSTFDVEVAVTELELEGSPAHLVVARDVTAERAAYDGLERSERQLREAQQIGRIGSWEWNIRTDRMVWSEEMYRLLGLDPERFQPSFAAYLELVHPEDRAEVRRIVQDAIDSRSGFSHERRIVRPDGDVRVMHSRGEVVVDESGEAVRMVGVAQDVTDLRRAEASLRRYANIARTMPIGLYVWCLEDEEDLASFRLIATNPAATGFTGSSVEESVGRTMPEVFPSLLRTEFPALYREVIRSGEPRFLGEVRYGDEKVREGVFSVRLIPLPERCVGVLFENVTERRRAAETLAASEERFRLIAGITSDAVWDWDLSSGSLWWSESFCTLFGYGAGEVEPTIGFWEERIHPEDSARVLASLQSAIDRGKRKWSGEYRFRRRDGSYAQIHDSGYTLFDSAGRAVRMVGAMTDITRRRALEDLLRQAQKMEAVGQLAGGIAHDFNNLLTAILGYADLLLAQMRESDPLRADVEEIRRAGRRAAALTGQLLAFSRKQVLVPEELDLGVVVMDLSQMLRRIIGEDVRLVTRVHGSGLCVRADRGQLEQIILNLAVNARDAMPGGGNLTVEVCGDPDLADKVLLSIQDDGAGMDAETRSHLFEPFFTTKESGTGLGLATVYGIVEQSGGAIGVESQPGEGAIFEIRLPRSARAPSSAGALRSHPPPRGGGETILLVEDEEVVRRMVREILEANGYRVLSAARGEEALETASRHGGPIHMLLTDVVMPEMGGGQLAERLRNDRPGLEVLYMSGYPDDTIVQRGIQAHQLVLLQKPFDPSSLISKVREVLDRPGPPRAAGAGRGEPREELPR